MEGIGEHVAYDRTIAVFSPDGRLLQVEYAREAVKRGIIVVGIRTKDFCLLTTPLQSRSKLVAENSTKKMYKIDDHKAAAACGLLADARYLINLARVKAQVHKLTYGEEASVKKIADYIAENKHVVTQYGGLRPYGVGFLIAGYDTTGTKLFETDPSGIVTEWNAHAIGKNTEKAKKVLEASYKYEMDIKSAINLAIKAIRSAEKIDKNIEIAIVDKTGVKIGLKSEFRGV